VPNSGTIVVSGNGRYGNIGVVPRTTTAIITGTIVGIAGGNAYSLGVLDTTGIYTGDTVRFVGTTSEYIVASITGTLVNLTGPFDIGYAKVNDTVTFIGKQYPKNFHNTGTFVSTSSFTTSMYNNIINITNKTYRFDYRYQLPDISTISDLKAVDEYGTLSTGSVYNLKGTLYAEEHSLQVAYADPDGVNTNTFQVNVSTTITNTSSNDLVTVDIAHQWLPAGSIIMWTKPQYKIPYGWWLCDGSTTPDGMPTPDLRNKFVIGADSELNDVPTVTNRRNIQITEGGSSSGVLLPHDHSGTATTFAVYDPGHAHLAVGPNTTSPLPDPSNDLKGPYDPSPQIKTFWGFTTEATPIASQWETRSERTFQDLHGHAPDSNSGIELETRITIRSTGTDATYSNLPQYKSLYFIYKWITPANADLGVMYAYPPSRGTLLSHYCDGTTKMGIYADGDGGNYNQVIQVNSLECGYVPPVPSILINSVTYSGGAVSLYSGTGGGVSISYTPANVTSGTWSDNAGRSGTFDATRSGSFTITVPGTQAPNTYTVTLTVNGPNGPASATTTYTVASFNVTILLVGGGGGGGGHGGGGGGGAGGYISNSTSLNVSQTYTVIVGGGGAGGSQGGSAGSNGCSSTFNGLTALGGGGGGAPWSAGNSGGSGGGSGGNNSTSGAGTCGQGNRGGKSNGITSGLPAGGGGGAGAVGADGNPGQAGSGGDGSTWTDGNIYAGGGGGGSRWDDPQHAGSGAGGAGGGGRGGDGAGSVAAVDGTPNTGGGGGGAQQWDNGGRSMPGASGGSGIVIIKYSGSQVFNGGNVRSAGGFIYHTFTSSGNLTPM